MTHFLDQTPTQPAHVRTVDLSTLSKKMTGLVRLTLAMEQSGDSALVVQPVKPDGTPRNPHNAQETAELGPLYTVNGKAYADHFEVNAHYVDGSAYLTLAFDSELNGRAGSTILAALAPVLADMRASVAALADLSRAALAVATADAAALRENLPVITDILHTYTLVSAQVATDAQAGTLRAGVPAVELFGPLHSRGAPEYQAQQQLIRDTLTPGTVFLVNGVALTQVRLYPARLMMTTPGDRATILARVTSLTPDGFAQQYRDAAVYTSGALRLAYHRNGEG